MTENPYECTSHKLDFCCLGCVKAWIARHDKMKDFIDNLHKYYIKYDETSSIAQDAAELLKELGLLKGK